jgi:hypothetical protein
MGRVQKMFEDIIIEIYVTSITVNVSAKITLAFNYASHN